MSPRKKSVTKCLSAILADRSELRRCTVVPKYMANPYQTPNTVSDASVLSEVIRPRRLDWLVWGGALVPIASVYFVWLVAWLTLGYPPRPSLDDPSQISPTVSAVYFISGLFLVSLPVSVIAGPIVQLIAAGRSLPIRGTYAVISVAVSVGAILLLRWDPLDVVYWYMD